MKKYNTAGKLLHEADSAAKAANSDGGSRDDNSGVSALRFAKDTVSSSSRAVRRSMPAHKRKLKKGFANAYRGKKAHDARKKAKRAKQAEQRARQTFMSVVRFIWNNKVVIGFVIAALLLIILLVSSCNACLSLAGGSLVSVVATSYVAEDGDILGADGDYEGMERELADEIARVEADYPGYDEYRYFVDEIGHDPFVLASYLTVKHNMYTRADVQGALAYLFGLQYELTLTPVTEIRERAETRTRTVTAVDPETGEEYEIEEEYEETVEYEYRILEVRLKNTSLGRVVTPLLSVEELELYRLYMEFQGNRPELFEGHPHASRREYMLYEIPPDALEDGVFAAMIAEAEKYLGFPYVWGGSSPSTSFDCSGFVSWVVNNSGWNLGRLTAKGLYYACTPVSSAEAKPGDLIFFNYTYAAPEPHLPTHVGIYVGNNMMIHAGNPISYARTDTKYYSEHFFSYARLP